MVGITMGLIATVVSLAPLPDEAKLPPGQPAPAWSGLMGTDGARHALADLGAKKAVVVVFFANSCPDSADYEDRIIALAKDYAAKPVAVVMVNVSLLPDDDLAHMTERARRKGYPCAFLFDPSQQIGRRFAARVTPTTFVLDPSRKVVYRGAIDDNFQPDRVKKHYVRDAIDAVLAGRPVATPETDSIGCDIDYEKPAR